MREYQPISSAHPSRVGQRCPKCPQSRMVLVKVEQGQIDGDYHTFECQRCGHAETLIVSNDLMESEIRGRLDDELIPPA
jgi:hypothetical protein